MMADADGSMHARVQRPVGMGRFRAPVEAAARAVCAASQGVLSIKAVVEKMKGDRSKRRVTFYYLLAEATNTLGKLA